VRKETYTEIGYRNGTRQYYYCSRYRVYLRRDLLGIHVVKIILNYADVDSRRFFCRRPDNNNGSGGRGDRCEIGNRERKTSYLILYDMYYICYCPLSSKSSVFVQTYHYLAFKSPPPTYDTYHTLRRYCIILLKTSITIYNIYLISVYIILLL